VELRIPVIERTVRTGSVLAAAESTVSERTVDANYTLVPVLVCRRPLRTVGLGDAISASALVAQIYQNALHD
jgi:ADP-dependent phosphofructokinase/glucokinase